MARLYNTFDFVGHIFIPNDQNKFHRVNESASGWEGHTLTFAVQESKNNSVFVELYGGYNKAKPNTVYSFSKGLGGEKGSPIEIPWNKRLDPDIVNMVADFRKIIVDFTIDEDVRELRNDILAGIRRLEFKDHLTDEDKKELAEYRQDLRDKVPERYEFIHPYDAVLALANQLPVYKDHKFRIRGDIEFNEWNGEFYRKFVPRVIEIVPEDTPNQLKAQIDIYFTKDSLDDRRVRSENRVYIDGYVLSYDYKAKKDQFFPQQFVINTEKVDFENEKQVRLLELLKKQFKVTGRGVYHLPWEVNIFRGAETVEFTEKDLTPEQRELVAFGLNKVEDFAPKGGLLGEAIQENRLVKPILRNFGNGNDFSSGAVETEFTEDDLVFEFTKQEQKQQNTVSTPLDKSSDATEALDQLEDLFG